MKLLKDHVRCELPAPVQSTQDLIFNITASITRGQSYLLLINSPCLGTQRIHVTSISDYIQNLVAFYNPHSVEARAESDAASFEWPSSTLSLDGEIVNALGSLQTAIKHKQSLVKSNRFNGVIADTHFINDPEYLTLRDIAVHGARIEAPPDWVPQLVPPPYRNLQKRIPLTVQKHACKL